MPIRYILKQLILPPGGLLLLLLLGWWLRRRAPRFAALCFVLGFGGLWLMSLPAVVEWGARLVETEPALPESQWPSLGQRAGAIVVLGADANRTIRPGAATSPALWRWSVCVTLRASRGPRNCRCCSAAGCISASRQARRASAAT